MAHRHGNKSHGTTFQILKVLSMKMAAIWNVRPCSLVEADNRLRGAYCLHHKRYKHAAQLTRRPDDGGSTLL
jgi:hypothetical protein